jgi:hypothetical protein
VLTFVETRCDLYNRALLVFPASPWDAWSCKRTTTMRSKIIAHLIALSAMLARAWSNASVRRSEFFVNFLGIAARFAIAFPACLIVYNLINAVIPCFVPLSRLLDLFWCPLVIMVYADTEPTYRDSSGQVPPHYFYVVLLALAIVAVWATNDRRRRNGKGWF